MGFSPRLSFVDACLLLINIMLKAFAQGRHLECRRRSNPARFCSLRGGVVVEFGWPLQHPWVVHGWWGAACGARVVPQQQQGLRGAFSQDKNVVASAEKKKSKFALNVSRRDFLNRSAWFGKSQNPGLGVSIYQSLTQVLTHAWFTCMWMTV